MQGWMMLSGAAGGPQRSGCSVRVWLQLFKESRGRHGPAGKESGQ